MDGDPFKEYIKASEPEKRVKNVLLKCRKKPIMMM